MCTENVSKHGSGGQRPGVDCENGNQPVPSVSEDTGCSPAGTSAGEENTSNPFGYLHYMAGLAVMNVILFFAALLCLSYSMITADAANVVMLEQMLEQSYSRTVMRWAQSYSDYLQVNHPDSPCAKFDARLLAEFILSRLGREAVDNPLSRFKAQLGFGRRAGNLPDDLDDHYGEMMDFFNEAIDSGEPLDKRLKGLGRAEEFGSVRRKLKNDAVKDAVSVAGTELMLHIGSRLPEILREFHREHTGGIVSGMLNPAIEAASGELIPFDRGGALLGGERDSLVEPPSQGKKDIPALRMLERFFSSRQDVLKGPVAMGAILFSEELRLTGRKEYGKITGNTRYDAIRRRAFAEDFYDEMLVGKNLTVRQLVEYIDYRLAVQFQVRFPVSVYNKLCADLESKGMLDVPVVESMYPLRKQGDHRKRMVGYISSAVGRNRKAIRSCMDGTEIDEKH